MSFIKATTTEARSILKSMPADIEALSAWATKELSVDAPTLRKKLSKAGVDNKCNKELRNLMDDLRQQLATHVDHMFVLERWIQSNVPRIETGNNFGVSVQYAVMKTCKDARTVMSELLVSFPGYFSTRAGAVEKALAASETSSATTSGSKSESTGGKAEDAGEKTSKSESTESKTVTNKTLPADYAEAVVAADVQLYIKLKHAAAEVVNALSYVHHAIELNKARVEPPSNSGGMPMY